MPTMTARIGASGAPRHLACAVALVEDEHRLAGAGPNRIDGDEVLAGGLAREIEKIHEQLSTAVECRQQKWWRPPCRDPPDLHRSAPALSSTASTMPTMAWSTGPGGTWQGERGLAAGDDDTRSPGAAMATPSAATTALPRGLEVAVKRLDDEQPHALEAGVDGGGDDRAGDSSEFHLSSFHR